MIRFTHKLDDTTELVLLEVRHSDEMYTLVDTSREHLGPWLPWVDAETSPGEARAFIRDMLFKFASGTDLVAGISYKGRLAGAIGIHDINTHNSSAEIGYWLGAEFEGKGLMTKACVAMLNHAFYDLGMNRVQIRVEPANTRSRAIPRRLGFHYEGTFAKWAECAKGEPISKYTQS